MIWLVLSESIRIIYLIFSFVDINPILLRINIYYKVVLFNSKMMMYLDDEAENLQQVTTINYSLNIFR